MKAKYLAVLIGFVYLLTATIVAEDSSAQIVFPLNQTPQEFLKVKPDREISPVLESDCDTADCVFQDTCFGQKGIRVVYFDKNFKSYYITWASETYYGKDIERDESFQRDLSLILSSFEKNYGKPYSITDSKKEKKWYWLLAPNQVVTVFMNRPRGGWGIIEYIKEHPCTKDQQ